MPKEFTITDTTSEIGGTCSFPYRGFTIELDNRYHGSLVAIHFGNTYCETKETVEGAINYCNHLIEMNNPLYHAAVNLLNQVGYHEDYVPTYEECKMQLARAELRRDFEMGSNQTSKIVLIKQFRDTAQCGLKEAKEAVEEMIDFTAKTPYLKRP